MKISVAVQRLCEDETTCSSAGRRLFLDSAAVVGGVPVFYTARIARLRGAEIACVVARGGRVVIFCRRGRCLLSPRVPMCFVFVAAVFFEPQSRSYV